MTTSDELLKAITGSDPYATPAAYISGFQYKPYEAGDEKTAIGVALGQALLGGVLGGLSSNYRADQAGQAVDLMSALQKDPYGTKRPQSIDNDVFQALRVAAVENQLKREQEFADDLIKRDRDYDYALKESAAEKNQDILSESPEYRRGIMAGRSREDILHDMFADQPDDVIEHRAPQVERNDVAAKPWKGIPYAADEEAGEVMPDDEAREVPKVDKVEPADDEISFDRRVEKLVRQGYKVQDAQQMVQRAEDIGRQDRERITSVEDKALQRLSSGDFSDFRDVRNSFETMKATFKYNDRPSTAFFLQHLARVLDPGSVVRGQELDTAKNTATLVSKLGYSFQSLIDGTEDLDPTDKLRMLQAAAEKYNVMGSDLAKYVGRERDLVQSRGGNPKNIYGSIEYEPFDFVEWARANKDKRTTLEEELARDPSAGTGLLDAAKQFPNTPEGRAAFKAQYGGG